MTLKTDLTERVKALFLQGADIILIRESERHLVPYLQNMKLDTGKKHLGVMLVNDFDDIKALDEGQMKQLGWQKIKTSKIISLS